MSTIVQTPNAEAIAAWDGPLYDRFVQFRQIVTDGLGVHGEQALRLHPPRYGERVLDVGCGFGDTTQQLATLVGPHGEAVGIDAAARFIETAREEAEAAGVDNARFEVADVQQDVPGEPYEMAFSRFGTMFFANPVVALRNIRRAPVTWNSTARTRTSTPPANSSTRTTPTGVPARAPSRWAIASSPPPGSRYTGTTVST